MAFSDEQLTDLRARLGIADDAGEDAILAAVDELAAAATADPPEAPRLPDGVVTIDAEQLAQLRADATAGREARDQQAKDRRSALVAAAVKDGRIAPARAQAWLDQLEADPGAEQVLASLEPGLIPVEDSERGSGADDLETEDAAVMAALFPGEEVKS